MRKEGAKRQSAKAIAAGIPGCGDQGHPVDFMAAITETVACLFKFRLRHVKHARHFKVRRATRLARWHRSFWFQL